MGGSASILEHHLPVNAPLLVLVLRVVDFDMKVNWTIHLARFGISLALHPNIELHMLVLVYCRLREPYFRKRLVRLVGGVRAVFGRGPRFRDVQTAGNMVGVWR